MEIIDVYLQLYKCIACVSNKMHAYAGSKNPSCLLQKKVNSLIQFRHRNYCMICIFHLYVGNFFLVIFTRTNQEQRTKSITMVHRVFFFEEITYVPWSNVLFTFFDWIYEQLYTAVELVFVLVSRASLNFGIPDETLTEQFLMNLLIISEERWSRYKVILREFVKCTNVKNCTAHRDPVSVSLTRRNYKLLLLWLLLSWCSLLKKSQGKLPPTNQPTTNIWHVCRHTCWSVRLK